MVLCARQSASGCLQQLSHITYSPLFVTPLQRLYDYLTLVFHEAPDSEKKIVNFSVSTQFPKLELTDMSLTIEAVVSALVVFILLDPFFWRD